MREIYKNTMLISEAYFKENSPIPDNYNWKEITPFVTLAQRIWLRPVIGDKLYEELLKEVKNNNVTAENSTLLLKTYPFLSMCIVYESMTFLAYNFNEKGITQNKSETSEPIGTQEFTQIKNDVRAKIEILKDELVQFINEHKECYPLYVGKSESNSDLRIFNSNGIY